MSDSGTSHRLLIQVGDPAKENDASNCLGEKIVCVVRKVLLLGVGRVIEGTIRWYQLRCEYPFV